LGSIRFGTILLDTANLDPSPTNAKDEAAAARLSALVGTPKDTTFSKVQYEKFNAGSLTTPELLRKDYKEWHADNARPLLFFKQHNIKMSRKKLQPLLENRFGR
jgi:inorganic pyrophosphatase/exopolyphosphatase